MEQTKVSPSNIINMFTTIEPKSAEVEYHEIAPSIKNEEEVRVVTSMKEYKSVAQCLSEAFATDEVARYFVDTDDMAAYSEEYKMKLHTEILEYVTAAHILKGVVTVVGDNYDGVALWMPPGKMSDDLLTIFRSGMWRLWYKLSAEGKKRFHNEFLPLLHNTAHEALAPYNDEAWYLVYLGTRPGSRGKGYAKKLIEHGTKLADASNHVTYLESSAAVNVPYYQKFGFETLKDIHLQRGKRPIPLNIMLRKPGNKVITKNSKLQGGVMIMG